VQACRLSLTLRRTATAFGRLVRPAKHTDPERTHDVRLKIAITCSYGLGKSNGRREVHDTRS